MTLDAQKVDGVTASVKLFKIDGASARVNKKFTASKHITAFEYYFGLRVT